MPKLYQEILLDGSSCWELFTLEQWTAANQCFASDGTYLADVRASLARLEHGEIYRGGGGASPEFMIRCAGNYEPESTP